MIEQLGPTPLFVGVESESWALHDFTAAAQSAKALGVSSLLIKIADGANEWYGGIGGWITVLSTIEQSGMKAVPYTYSYGNKYGALQAEVNLLVSAMHVCGIVIADMEAEWNGQITWAEYTCTALKPISGVFGVCSWADPQEQQWAGVLQALAPCVNFWMPQVYSNALAANYQAQYQPYNLPCFPIVNLGTDFGDNAPIDIAKNSGSDTVGFWEYEAAISTYSTVVKYIVALKGDYMSVPNGWKYDAATKTLTAPNNIQVTNGFAQYIVTNTWDANDLPRTPAYGRNVVEVGNPALGGGTIQVFNESILAWLKTTNIVYKMYVGKEYLAIYTLWNKAQTDLTSAQAQIAALQQQITQLQNQTPIPANISQAKQAINAINQLAEQLKSDGDTLSSAAQNALKALGQ